MGQLAAGIAHEVNNPLGVVLMYCPPAAGRVPTESALRQDLAMIAEQADRCKKIVAGLLDFARQNKVAAPARGPAGRRGSHDPADLPRSPTEIEVRMEHQHGRPRWPKWTATRSSRCSPTWSATPSAAMDAAAAR